MKDFLFKPFPKVIGRIGRIIEVVVVVASCIYFILIVFLYVMTSDVLMRWFNLSIGD